MEKSETRKEKSASADKLKALGYSILFRKVEAPWRENEGVSEYYEVRASKQCQGCGNLVWKYLNVWRQMVYENLWHVEKRRAQGGCRRSVKRTVYCGVASIDHYL